MNEGKVSRSMRDLLIEQARHMRIAIGSIIGRWRYDPSRLLVKALPSPWQSPFPLQGDGPEMGLNARIE